MNMLERFRRIAEWVRRMPRSRGFGVQSPFAYHFVRHVAKQRHIYHGVGKLCRDHQHLTARHRRRCMFYLRMADYMRPHAVFCLGETGQAERDYVLKGWPQATFVAAEAGVVSVLQEQADEVCLVLVPTGEAARTRAMQALPLMGGSSAMIVEGIYADEASQACWQSLVASARVGVSFDLYDCGVLFFDTKRYKQNYKINLR